MKPAKEFIAKPATLAESIDYQRGPIVSKTIIDKKTGIVTLFAFDEDQGLSEHTAPFVALVYLLDGEAKITISGNPIRAKGGELLVMLAKEPHSSKALKRF